MIDLDLAAALQEGIAIQLGTRNARQEPNGVRVVAVSVDHDGTHVIAYVPDVSVHLVLPDLESSRQAAAVVARPPDERAWQVKGTFTGARAATPDERPMVQAQWDRWLDRLTTIGLPRPTLERCTTWPCTAIRVRVNAI